MKPTFFARPKVILLTLFVIFFGPMLLAYFFYSSGIKPGQGTVNHGHLITPPVQLKKLTLRDSKGKWINPRTLRHQWLVAYVHPGQCARECLQQVRNMRQIRKAMGKDRKRVQRVLITFSSSPQQGGLVRALRHDYLGTQHFEVSPRQFVRFVRPAHNKKVALTQGTMYLVDPLGNMLMWYDANASAMDVFKDLKRLLRNSQIG